MFQFHFGLIKRKGYDFTDFVKSLFQFHFGLIKRAENKNSTSEH